MGNKNLIKPIFFTAFSSSPPLSYTLNCTLSLSFIYKSLSFINLYLSPSFFFPNTTKSLPSSMRMAGHTPGQGRAYASVRAV